MNRQWIKVRRIKAKQGTEAKQVRSGAIASAVLLFSIAAGCTNQPTANLSPSPASQEVALGTATPQPLQQPLQQPMPSISTALKPVPVPNLIPATAAPEHLPEVTTGRPDPFATLLMSPTRVMRTASAPIAPSAMSLPVPSVAPTAPVTAAMPVPQTLPTFQTPANHSGLPANAVPPLNVAPPISAAQAIEVSGIVQAGNATSIIIKAPDERTSRYVSVGDRLANGRVLVKRIEMGAEPVVILEQDGAEIIKAIGSRGAIGTL